MIFLKSKRLEKKTSDAREPSLYRSICTSIISTLLSLVMLVGTTFAWFTDSITSNVFTITAGNFPAETYYWVGNGEPTEFPSDETNREATTGGWQDVEENADIFNGMQFNSEGPSQSPQQVYLALVNKSEQNAATYKFYFESVAESNSEGSNNIKDALTFTRKTASTISELTNVTAETRTLAEFAGTSEANSRPFVITVEENTTKYVELTIDVGDISHASITPSSIQLRLKIIVTNAGEGSEENIISQLNELMTPSEPVSVPVVTEIENEETSTTEPPTMGTPTAGTPATGTSTMGTPATEPPTTGTPATGTPATETPTTEPPTTGTPTTGTPTTETSTTETSTTEPPATGTPTTGTSTTGMPTMEMPTEETSET